MSSMKLQKSCAGYYKQQSSRNAILQPMRSISQPYTGSSKELTHLRQRGWELSEKPLPAWSKSPASANINFRI